jgi:hypothetical protein
VAVKPKWNPTTQRMEYPPTKRQSMTLRDRRRQLEVPPGTPWPKTKADAQREIGALLRRTRSKRERDRRDATREAMAALDAELQRVLDAG